MFDPIERRNSAGDATQILQVSGSYDRPVLLIEDGDGNAAFDLDDAALDEAITQLCIIRTNRRIAREVQEQRFVSAASRGYGDHSTPPIRRSADGDRLIDRVR